MRLKEFKGRAQDYSPKARLRALFGAELPFDRHDWVVDRGGAEVRYVIDFYNAPPTDGKPIGMFVDVRPALDSVQSVVDRVRMNFRRLVGGRPTATPTVSQSPGAGDAAA